MMRLCNGFNKVMQANSSIKTSMAHNGNKNQPRSEYDISIHNTVYYYTSFCLFFVISMVTVESNALNFGMIIKKNVFSHWPFILWTWSVHANIRVISHKHWLVVQPTSPDNFILDYAIRVGEARAAAVQQETGERAGPPSRYTNGIVRWKWLKHECSLSFQYVILNALVIHAIEFLRVQCALVCVWRRQAHCVVIVIFQYYDHTQKSQVIHPSTVAHLSNVTSNRSHRVTIFTE